MAMIVWLVLWTCLGGQVVHSIPLPDRLTCEALRQTLPTELSQYGAPAVEAACVSSETRPVSPPNPMACVWGS